MSWLDANEVFLMEVVSRDRIEELRLAIALAKEPAEEPAEAACEPRDERASWPRRMSAAA
jgi:hypothetical protein